MITAPHQMAILTGALAGIGVVLLVWAFWPRDPSLAHAISTLTRTEPAADADRRWVSRLGVAVMRRWPAVFGLRIPSQDLALLEIPVARYIGERVALAASGWVVPVIASLLFGPSPLLTAVAAGGVGPAIGIGLSFLPDANIKSSAARARQEFMHSLSAYSDLVALQVASGIGTSQALKSAATIGDSWVFTRLDEELRIAEHTHTPPWDALRDIANDLHVPALRDIADIFALSAEKSVTVGDSLQDRAQALRDELSAEDLERANSASEQLNAPLGLLVMMFAVILVVPAFLRLI